MEIQIVAFLGLAAFAIIINSVILFVAYRSLAGLTTRVTKTVSEFSHSSETRQWIESCQIAAERAAVISETTKVKLTEFDEKLGRAQENYRIALATADMRLEKAAEGIDTAAKGMRNIVAKPAKGVAKVAASVTRFLEGDRTGQ